MDLNSYIARAYAAVMSDRARIERNYAEHAEVYAFWAMIDLVDSTKYRIANGPREGYVRGELFYSTVRTVLEPVETVSLVKELGDAVLLCCPHFSTLFESLLLVHSVAAMFASADPDDPIPLVVRSGVNHGAANTIGRGNAKHLPESPDYLGRPIDELSRVMAVRSPNTSMLMHEDAYSAAKEALKEYTSFTKVQGPHTIPSAIAKGSVTPIYYYEVLLDRVALGRTHDGFEEWRSLGTRGQ